MAEGGKKRVMAGHQRVKAELRRLYRDEKRKKEKKKRRTREKTLLIFSCYGGISSKYETFKWKTTKKKKTCFFLLSCFAAIFGFVYIKCQYNVIGFNFLIENYDIIDNFGSFGSFFYVINFC